MIKNKLSHETTQTLILGSSSPFRKELLQRLQLSFSTESPNIDETHLLGESPHQLVERLSILKAQKIAETNKDALIIGSDQVAILGDDILGKPGTVENARQQLRNSSGNAVKFLTGLCLLNAKTGERQVEVIPYSVVFRELSESQIKAYVEMEQPLNCAGSFKSEGLGAALFEKMEGEDPTALIGLPLIRLVSMLRHEGIEVLR